MGLRPQSPVVDEQVVAARPKPSVQARRADREASLGQLVSAVFDGYADRPALGQRAAELVTEDGRRRHRLLPEFTTITYRELANRVAAVASGLRPRVGRGEFVGILGHTSPDLVTLDLACLPLDAVSVPLQASASPERLAPVLAETGAVLLATSVELLDLAAATVEISPSVRHLVVFDLRFGDQDHEDRVAAARQRLGIPVDTLSDVLDRGLDLPPVAQRLDPRPDRIVTLIYTSGSTGTPKGAVYTERMVADLWRGVRPLPEELGLISVQYLPQSHIMGRAVLTDTLASGGTAYFTGRPDQSTLFEDHVLVRPTEVVFVPRLCDLLLRRYRDHPGTREQALAHVREELLGDRVAWAGTGSAPLSEELTSFFRDVLGVHLHDLYGSTEARVVLIDGRVQRWHVLDFKLVDVPELGYRGTDTPYPRGELLLRVRGGTTEYYKRPEATASVLDEDGYYRTGDIMALTGPDTMAYVDRRNNVLKLSQGEFVALSTLEAQFVNSPLVHQIHLHGNSERAYLLAVVVPTPEALAEHGDGLAAAVLESLRELGREHGLNSYEVPRDVLVETEPFSTANGLLSDVRKQIRPKLRERYGPALERRYAAHAEAEGGRVARLRAAAGHEPVLATVCRAAETLLNQPEGSLGAGDRFGDLGGDSLSAVGFVALLKEVFAVDVPVALVIDPTADLGRLAAHIEHGTGRPTAASVHGEDRATIHARDLELAKFLDPALLAGAGSLPAAQGPVRTVLLTGATGYLGRFLCLDWLSRLAPDGGTLVCVVRGRDERDARARLAAVFDGAARERFDALSAHLRVLAGDIGEAGLGLPDETWRELASTVDLVVHPAALVNHVLPYEELFGPNVLGTAEVIRLALTTRRKPVNYVSTVAVLSGAPQAAAEEADIRSASPSRTLDGAAYATGYGASKWAGEVLLREAHARFALPVAVFRSDLILAHTTYPGQLNVPDVFTRLLYSLVLTGLAPHSFYAPDATRPRAHYDGLPVDFTSAAITALGGRGTEGYRTYNVLNPHDDNISLDTFVDWLLADGHHITRLDSYQDWLTRFEEALRALPERQRSQSVLPLLTAFRTPAPAVPGSAVPAPRFRSAVQEAAVGPDKDIPHLDHALITKYITDLRQLGLLA
ncbi:fatty acid CoA ligase FadD9 [Crossiella equi]|uniref:Fatty acid CoA ligase FadD9 n=1 Tax=Crossiella equi TaxID=130796 RepID=A0ABS5AP96_9PSEU|nr:carboxylic acid reductase [Crossiella equi]MBP2478387.1 fatty acid CoA ligase FadD9 [Crossiella equi]